MVVPAVGKVILLLFHLALAIETPPGSASGSCRGNPRRHGRGPIEASDCVAVKPFARAIGWIPFPAR
jgi:hypothetical protein